MKLETLKEDNVVFGFFQNKRKHIFQNVTKNRIKQFKECIQYSSQFTMVLFGRQTKQPTRNTALLSLQRYTLKRQQNFLTFQGKQVFAHPQARNRDFFCITSALTSLYQTTLTHVPIQQNFSTNCFLQFYNFTIF